MISVVIPLYNKALSIEKTIQSVIKQSFTEFEIIVVNDGSVDDSLDIVKLIQDHRVKIIDKPNGGVSSARNRGIIEASNEYIAFLDGDDLWQHDHLQNLVEMTYAFDDDNVGGFATSFVKLINPDAFKPHDKGEVVLVNNYFQFMVEKKDSFNSSTLMIKKSKVAETGAFNENLTYGEDVEFWYRLFTRYQLVFNEKVSVIYNIGAENRSDHNITPLDKRFWIYDYKNATDSEKKYFDKLVAILLIDYFPRKQYSSVWRILAKYNNRLLGILKYYYKLIINKIRP